jgi:hypothetical protein
MRGVGDEEMNSGGTGIQPLNLLIGWMALAFIFFLILQNWQSIKTGIAIFAVIGVGLGLAFLALVVVVMIGVAGYEGYKTKQCETVYERVAKAQAAPYDYFGNKLRTDADAEQSSCNELATRLAERAKNAKPDDFDPLDIVRRVMQR